MCAGKFKYLLFCDAGVLMAGDSQYGDWFNNLVLRRVLDNFIF